MAVYNTGTVRVKAGSAAVKGETGVESFLTYVSAGYLFKIESESTWYEVAAVSNATNFTLSSRYDNASYRTSRTGEHSATMTTATKMYSGTVDNTPVIQSNFTMNASIEAFTDDGAGVLTGDGSPAGSGTVDYDTGTWSITLGTDLTATAVVTASYLSGDTRSGMSYQVVTDYTTNYSFPEMNVNDTNFQYIYTKAMRMIDGKMYNASMNNASIVSAFIGTLKTSHSKHTTASLTTASINIAKVSHIKASTATLTNASVNTLKSTNYVKAINYVQVGSEKYIFAGNSTTSAAIIAEATALVATPIKGSLYMGVGDTWKFDSDTTATKL